MVSIVGSESTHPLAVPILVVDQVPVVRLLGEWYQHMLILPPSTLHVALVVGIGMVVVVAAYALLIGFPILDSEITSTTNEQKLFSSVSFFVSHSSALAELLPIATPNRMLRPHIW